MKHVPDFTDIHGDGRLTVGSRTFNIQRSTFSVQGRKAPWGRAPLRGSRFAASEHSWLFDVGSWMLDVGCWLLVVGRSMFDVRCSMFLIQRSTFNAYPGFPLL